MPVVTITGRVGTLARPVGLEVARLLGADYVDQQIIAEAALRSGSTLESVAERDERGLRGRQRLARFLQNFLEKSAAAGSAGDPFLGPTGVEVLLSRTFAEAGQPAPDQAHAIDDQRYLKLITSVVTDLASTGNVVLIGRGSHVILKDKPKALHVYITASEETRNKYIMEREGLPREAALKYVKENEAGRIAYYKKFFKVNSEDPVLFHMALNADKMGIGHSARIIADAAREMERVATPAPS